MSRLFGFPAGKDPDWNPWWIAMWVATTPTWIFIAFMHPISQPGKFWVAPLAFLLLFLVQEIIAIKDKNVRTPPLTHVIRSYMNENLTFPLMYFLLGAVGGCWFGFPPLRYLGLGAMFAMLGWLTIHFTLSYINLKPGECLEGTKAAGDQTPRRHVEL